MNSGGWKKKRLCDIEFYCMNVLDDFDADNCAKLQKKLKNCVINSLKSGIYVDNLIVNESGEVEAARNISHSSFVGIYGATDQSMVYTEDDWDNIFKEHSETLLQNNCTPDEVMKYIRREECLTKIEFGPKIENVMRKISSYANLWLCDGRYNFKRGDSDTFTSEQPNTWKIKDADDADEQNVRFVTVLIYGYPIILMISIGDINKGESLRYDYGVRYREQSKLISVIERYTHAKSKKRKLEKIHEKGYIYNKTLSYLEAVLD